MHWKGLVLTLFLAFAPVIGSAQDRSLRLVVHDALNGSGLIDYLVPRFALKHGLRPTVTTWKDEHPAELEGADALILPEPAAMLLAESGLVTRPRPAFHEEDGGALTYSVAVLTDAAQPENAELFQAWLLSDIGQGTIASFSETGQATYVPGAGTAKSEVKVAFEGDVNLGKKLSLQHCGRCHVVSRENRFGGIGSTPSFMALRFLPDWESKFSAFWSKNPHPSFIHIRDVSPPFDPMKPPHIAPVVMEFGEVEAIQAFVASIEPMDLGAPLTLR